MSEKITICTVDEPDKNIMYVMNKINDNAVEYKLINNLAKFEIKKGVFGYQILIHCNKEDEKFWLGVWQGRDLGINLAKQMYSIS